MTDNDWTIEVPASAPVGTHPAIITRLERMPNTETVYGVKDLIKWVVTITLKDGTDVETDGVTGIDPTPRAKLTRWLAAAGVKLTPGKPLSPESIVGTPVLAVVGEDESGYTQLEELVAAPKA